LSPQDYRQRPQRERERERERERHTDRYRERKVAFERQRKKAPCAEYSRFLAVWTILSPDGPELSNYREDCDIEVLIGVACIVMKTVTLLISD
jgi:hypothetical protein